jgi:copper chaperone NosL
MRSRISLTLLFFGIFMGCLSAGKASLADEAGKGAPHAAVTAPDADGRLLIGPQDRCPVCGMFPVKHPRSAAAIRLTDGRAFYFCSNGCLLRSWYRSVDHLGVRQDKIAAIIVQDYFSGAPLDAKKAWWVAGSDVVGPMGPALVTLAGPEEVKVFKKRHGGRVVFQIDQLDDQLWRKLYPSKGE